MKIINPLAICPHHILAKDLYWKWAWYHSEDWKVSKAFPSLKAQTGCKEGQKEARQSSNFKNGNHKSHQQFAHSRSLQGFIVEAGMVQVCRLLHTTSLQFTERLWALIQVPWSFTEAYRVKHGWEEGGQRGSSPIIKLINRNQRFHRHFTHSKSKQGFIVEAAMIQFAHTYNSVVWTDLMEAEVTLIAQQFDGASQICADPKSLRCARRK